MAILYKNVIFWQLFANFGAEIISKYDSDWYETNVQWSKDTGNTFLTDLIDN